MRLYRRDASLYRRPDVYRLPVLHAPSETGGVSACSTSDQWLTMGIRIPLPDDNPGLGVDVHEANPKWVCRRPACQRRYQQGLAERP